MLLLKKIINFDALFFLFAGYLIIKGLMNREGSFLTAETGIGYMLGIIGGSMMLLLLFYPLRKHLRLMRNWGPIRYWFRLHMMLGVAGPVLVLYHSNFGFGSTNSNIAMICMLVVAGSGLFGRLFYSKIHDGLYGRKLELAELNRELQQSKEQLGAKLSQQLEQYQQSLLRTRVLPVMLLSMPVVYMKIPLLRRRILKKIDRSADQVAEVSQLKHYLLRYFLQIKRVYDFVLCERLFSLWHVLHIPLFIMMVISGIIHVFAVHLY
ncbi:MAG: transcriptional regulator [Gammaproteobacteria bacterium]|nr:transcriptional regulator [Gammaproteobacteria bacterium]MCW8910191.1 transcriptional regulator [Gammaproteobacteria bacterium]MCW9004345.1 transcriptional regulator [Gammaproteobacteria bacterium]MCW9057110.1 transcriptional regulator [Gammaproteobacteria bacterium]